MKIFSTEQIRDWDRYTIEHEPVRSAILMNRAAGALADWFMQRYQDQQRPVWIIAGTGNNGGDGVALARLLHHAFYNVSLFVCDFSGKHSADFETQIEWLPPLNAVPLQWLAAPEEWPQVPPNAILIDALFGSGLARPLEGPWAEIVKKINALPNLTISVDLPSGLFADKHSPGPCVEADYTVSFEAPKLAFFFPENAHRVGQWSCVEIGLHPEYARISHTPYHFTELAEVQALLRPRPKFAHKGTFGHALLIAGSYGKMGAAVLASRACLRSGVGLLSVHAPRIGNLVLQTAVPEAMYSADAGGRFWIKAPWPEAYNAVGVGPGIGTAPKTAFALQQLLVDLPRTLVLDADALNLLAGHPGWLPLLPPETILTPHPKEFERLFGSASDDFDRLNLLCRKAQELGVVILLKGAYTAIALPDGSCWFNSTGNPGMATGGSGDVLTGILLGLLAQGYSARDAAIIGVYWHGLAGDLAAQQGSEASLTSGDLVEAMGAAFRRVEPAA